MVANLSGLVTPTKSPRQISKHAAKDAMLESEFFKDLEAHEQQSEEEAHEAEHFWDTLSPRPCSESEPEDPPEPGRRVWTNSEVEKVHQAKVLLEIGRDHLAMLQQNRLDSANLGSGKKQRLLEHFWTPEKLCRPPEDDNALANFRNSRGPAHPASQTPYEQKNSLVKEAVEKIQRRNALLRDLQEKQRCLVNHEAQQILQTIAAVDQVLVPVPPTVAIQPPQQRRRRGRPFLTAEERQRRQAKKEIQGKCKKVFENCRLREPTPNAHIRSSVVNIANRMAISLHYPLGSSLTKGRWNSQVAPKTTLVNPWLLPKSRG